MTVLLLVTAVGTNGDQDDDERDIEDGDEDDNEGESNLEKCAQLVHFSMSIEEEECCTLVSIVQCWTLQTITFIVTRLATSKTMMMTLMKLRMITIMITTLMMMITMMVTPSSSGIIYSGEQSAMLDIANNFAGTLMGIINALGISSSTCKSLWFSS